MSEKLPFLKISLNDDFDDLLYYLPSPNNDIPVFNEISRESTRKNEFYPIHSFTTIDQLIDIFNSPNFPPSAHIIFQ